MAAQSESFDVAVVGGGAIGLACAREAQRRGARVVVLDAGAPGRLARRRGHARAGLRGRVRRARAAGARAGERAPLPGLRRARCDDAGLPRGGHAGRGPRPRRGRGARPPRRVPRRARAARGAAAPVAGPPAGAGARADGAARAGHRERPLDRPAQARRGAARRVRRRVRRRARRRCSWSTASASRACAPTPARSRAGAVVVAAGVHVAGSACPSTRACRCARSRARSLRLRGEPLVERTIRGERRLLRPARRRALRARRDDGGARLGHDADRGRRLRAAARPQRARPGRPRAATSRTLHRRAAPRHAGQPAGDRPGRARGARLGHRALPQRHPAHAGHGRARRRRAEPASRCRAGPRPPTRCASRECRHESGPERRRRRAGRRRDRRGRARRRSTCRRPAAAWPSRSTPRSSRAESGPARSCTRERGWKSCARSRGADMAVTDTNTDVLTIAGHTLRSRLLLGTGGFRSLDAMAAAIEASGSELVTVALRRIDPAPARLDRRRARPRGREAPAQHGRLLHRARRRAHRASWPARRSMLAHERREQSDRARARRGTRSCADGAGRDPVDLSRPWRGCSTARSARRGRRAPPGSGSPKSFSIVTASARYPSSPLMPRSVYGSLRHMSHSPRARRATAPDRPPDDACDELTFLDRAAPSFTRRELVTEREPLVAGRRLAMHAVDDFLAGSSAAHPRRSDYDKDLPVASLRLWRLGGSALSALPGMTVVARIAALYPRS